MCIDLHTHSIYSDGSCSPRQLVELAVSKKLSALALTDHDIMTGVDELVTHGDKHGIHTLSGVEVSALYSKISVHIIGYGIDHHNSEFIHWLDKLQEGREERNRNILLSLREDGIDITMEEVSNFSGTGLTGRPHIANVLIQKGIVRSFNEAFRYYLGRGKKAWHRRFCYTAIETIQAIHKAGGIAVLAHPGHLDPEMKLQPKLIRELAAYGLDGIEVYYPSHNAKMKKALANLAGSLDLLTTGGSDYHGETRPSNTMIYRGGPLCPPESIIDDLHVRLQQYR